MVQRLEEEEAASGSEFSRVEELEAAKKKLMMMEKHRMMSKQMMMFKQKQAMMARQREMMSKQQTLSPPHTSPLSLTPSFNVSSDEEVILIILVMLTSHLSLVSSPGTAW